MCMWGVGLSRDMICGDVGGVRAAVIADSALAIGEKKEWERQKTGLFW